MRTDGPTLATIRSADPDGWAHAEPTHRDREDFRLWVIASFGTDAWADYMRDGWDDPIAY